MPWVSSKASNSESINIPKEPMRSTHSRRKPSFNCSRDQLQHSLHCCWLGKQLDGKERRVTRKRPIAETTQQRSQPVLEPAPLKNVLKNVNEYWPIHFRKFALRKLMYFRIRFEQKFRIMIFLLKIRAQSKRAAFKRKPKRFYERFSEIFWDTDRFITLVHRETPGALKSK